MKEPPTYSRRPAHVGHGALRLVERKGSGHRPGVLVAVRVPEHDLLHVVTERTPVRRAAQDLLHDLGRRANQIQGDLLLVWGRQDPHIPADGRARIHRALDESGARWRSCLYDAEHAFMRDIGPRFDAEATDRAFGEMLTLFRDARHGRW